MKKLRLYLVLFPCGLLFAISCKKHSGEKPAVQQNFKIYINVLPSFNSDTVQLFIDGQEVLNKPETTNYSLGFAGGVSVTANTGNHKIRVVIDHGTEKTESFTLRSDLFIGINYEEPTGKVSFVYSDKPFAYD